MQINVRCFASLSQYAPADGICAIDENSDVSHLLQALGVPPGQVNIVLVNGRPASPETLLQDGDTASLVPLVGGG